MYIFSPMMKLQPPTNSWCATNFITVALSIKPTGGTYGEFCVHLIRTGTVLQNINALEALISFLQRESIKWLVWPFGENFHKRLNFHKNSEKFYLCGGKFSRSKTILMKLLIVIQVPWSRSSREPGNFLHQHVKQKLSLIRNKIWTRGADKATRLSSQLYGGNLQHRVYLGILKISYRGRWYRGTSRLFHSELEVYF